jgi:uncharacterized damage-inducible protein DinB
MRRRIDDIARLKETTDKGSMIVFEGILPEQENYRPHDGMMTFCEQLNHIAFVERYVINKINAGLNLGLEAPELTTDGRLADALTAVKSTWQLTAALLERLQDDHLDIVIELPEEKWKADVRYLLHVMVEHQIHHRGQLIVYFRTLGLAPPQRWRH